jgi:hypothetical protein
MIVYIVIRHEDFFSDTMKAFYSYESAIDYMLEMKDLYGDESVKFEIESIPLEE